MYGYKVGILLISEIGPRGHDPHPLPPTRAFIGIFVSGVKCQLLLKMESPPSIISS
jgi:hypothetical protein